MTLHPAIRGVLPALLMLGLVVRAGRAQQPPPSLGPTVRALAALPAAERARLVADSLVARVAAVSRDADGVPVAHVFIRLRTPDPGPLLRIGARLGTQTGTLVSARVPLDSLGALFATAGVTAVYGARRWAPVNDVGTSEIGVAGLRSSVAPGEFSGAIGRGVIVGLVDAGVDFTHPDFLNGPAGTSRILYLWDQTLSGAGPGAVGTALFQYGLECRQASLTSATCPSRDSTGHGTHVLGTAAGNGSATGGGRPAGQFAGVAPGADLIVVKSSLFTTAVVDGVDYIFGRAAELGRPAVVNLSLGSQWGPHDGTLPEEEALDSLEGPGRIIVAAAGNSGDNQNTTPLQSVDHLHGAAALGAAGTQATFTLLVPPYGSLPGANNDFIRLQLWYAAADTLTVTVVRPDNSFLTSPATAAGPASVTQDGTQGQIRIENGPGSSVAVTADNLGYIVLGDLGGGTAPQAGTWAIRVTSVAAHSGRPVHLWVADGILGSSGSLSGVSLVTGATNGFLVLSPATATRVLAAAAYTTRLQWQDVGGQTRAYPSPERLGDLAANSSPGPRRDGVVKPDIAAPGKGVASALSHDATVASERTTPDGRHWINQGTSMAAPFVTGSVALLLERSPKLTPEAVRTLLTGGARVDSFAVHPYDGGPNGTPNASWGFGKLFTPAALSALTNALLGPGGEINVSENPVRGASVVLHYAGSARRVTIYSFNGTRIRSFTAPPAGRLAWDLTTDDGRAVVNGVYVVVVDLGGSVVRRRLYVARKAGP